MESTLGKSLSSLAQIEKYEDAFEANRLPELLMPGELADYEEYLTMDSAALKKLSAEDCSIISLRLAQYSYYVQRMTNTVKAKINTIKSEINRCIAHTAHQYQGQWDLQKDQAIQDNDYTKDLHILLTKMQNRYDRLVDIAPQIKNISESFKNLKFDKIKKFQQNAEF